MTIPTILGQGVLLLGLILAAFARLGARRLPAIPRPHPKRDSAPPDSRVRIHPDRWPDTHSLAGVPLRILQSDPSGPGTLLRDTLLIRPSTRDH